MTTAEVSFVSLPSLNNELVPSYRFTVLFFFCGESEWQIIKQRLQNTWRYKKFLNSDEATHPMKSPVSGTGTKTRPEIRTRQYVAIYFTFFTSVVVKKWEKVWRLKPLLSSELVQLEPGRLDRHGTTAVYLMLRSPFFSEKKTKKKAYDSRGIHIYGGRVGIRKRAGTTFAELYTKLILTACKRHASFFEPSFELFMR